MPHRVDENDSMRLFRGIASRLVVLHHGVLVNLIELTLCCGCFQRLLADVRVKV